MPAKKFDVLAILAMLAFSAPVHAATVEDINFNNVVFSNGDVVSGAVSIDTSHLPAYSINIFPSGELNIDGLYFTSRIFLGSNSVTGLFYNGPLDPGGGRIVGPIIENIAVNLADLPDLGISDFTLTNVGLSQPPASAISGSVSCVGGCDVSAVPLPNALPMFGAALIGCMGFAAWRSRRTANL